MNKIIKESKGWYALLAVSILGTIVFSIIPLFQTVIDSMQNATGEYVGLSNFTILFNDIEFKQAMGNTLLMGILAVMINIPLSFMLANIINNLVWGKNIFKSLLLLPIIMSMVTVALLFKFIFSADENSIANIVLQLLGMEPSAWFNNPKMARQLVVIMTVWKNMGYNVILFFAGLQNVRKEYYEAASIDGANTYKQWVYITIPCMRNTFIFVYINMCINVMKRFTDVYAISGESGEPAGSLFTIMLFIYRKSFSTIFSKDLGAAAAASLVLFGVILLVTIINFILTENDILLRFKKKRVTDRREK